MKELIVSPVYNSKGNIVGQEYHGELIRCKDCLYLSRLEDSGYYSCCRTEDDEIELTDYCSKAKRKEE